MKSLSRAVGSLFIGCVFAFGFFTVCSEQQNQNTISIQQTLAQDIDKSNAAVSGSRQNAITRAVEHVSPAVVGINVTAVQQYYQQSPFADDPFFRHFFPRYRVMRQVESLGSGFIFDAEGHILTNYHVVENAVETIVTLTGGDQYEAELIGGDPKTDIAVLKIKGKSFPYAEFGDSDDVIIGEWAIAIGNPFGLFDVSAKPTVTVGVISAVDQDFGRQARNRYYEDMIQTDAAINSGNSGGPLVNCNGFVIGINTFIFSGSAGSGTNIGLGFAIPINRVKRHIDDLIKYGRVKRDFWTGIQYDELTRMVASYLQLNTTDGVIITDVEPKSPAESAGLQVGDVIQEMNGETIKNGQDVKRIIESEDLAQGDVLILEIYRRGKQLQKRVKLEPYPKE